MYALHLNIYVTDKCSRKCSYCYNPDNNEGDMSLTTAKDIGNWIGAFATKENVKNFRCHFLGGEPFLNLEAIFNITDTLDSNYSIPSASDGRYIIFTNGDYLTDENLKEVKLRNILIYIHCLNDISLEELENRILAVKEICHGCALSIVIDDSPVDRFVEIIKLAIKHKCHPRMNALYQVGVNYVEEYKKIYREKITRALSLILASGVAIYPNFLQSDLYITWDKVGVNPHFCGKCFYVINQFGKIRTCTLDVVESNNTIYNSYKKEDISFWQKHEAPFECKTCQWVTWCQGGCPVRRKIASTNKIYLCDVYKETFPIMFELKKRWLNRRTI